MIKKLYYFSNLCREKGWDWLAIKPLSLNPSDYLLHYVLVKNEKGEYVSYLLNQGYDSFTNGQYFNDLEAAIKYHTERGDF